MPNSLPTPTAERTLYGAWYFDEKKLMWLVFIAPVYVTKDEVISQLRSKWFTSHGAIPKDLAIVEETVTTHIQELVKFDLTTNFETP